MKSNLKQITIVIISAISIVGTTIYTTLKSPGNIDYEQDIRVKTKPIELEWKTKINKLKRE